METRDQWQLSSSITLYLTFLREKSSWNLEPMNSARLWPGSSQDLLVSVWERRASDSSSHTCVPGALATEPTPKPFTCPEVTVSFHVFTKHAGKLWLLHLYIIHWAIYSFLYYGNDWDISIWLAFGKLERELKICWYHCKQERNETLDRRKDQGCWGCSLQERRGRGGADDRQGDPGTTPVVSRRHRVECISMGIPENLTKSNTRRGKWCFCKRVKCGLQPVILRSVQTSKGSVTWELVQALPRICRESRELE